MKVNLIYTLVSLRLSKDLHIKFSIGYLMEMNYEAFSSSQQLLDSRGPYVCLIWSLFVIKHQFVVGGIL